MPTTFKEGDRVFYISHENTMNEREGVILSISSDGETARMSVYIGSWEQGEEEVAYDDITRHATDEDRVERAVRKQQTPIRLSPKVKEKRGIISKFKGVLSRK